MKLFFLVSICCIAISATAQNFVPVENSSTIKFVIGNLGFDVNGSLKGLAGTVVFDEKNLPASSFAVTVNSNSINTDNGTRDKHLRGADYFDAEKFPVIKITSVKVAKSVTPGYYVMFAKLTIKDKTQDISFPFTATAEGTGYRFKGKFKIKRRDFGVGGKNTISNELTVNLDVLSKKN
jgi:polyisoprenoid-binding protein YceI